MPTLNEYANDDGYYIRAHTSATGNITYKIRECGWPVVEQFQDGDGDEIAWSTIRALKSIGVIYTDQSGTLGPDDFVPDPDAQSAELSESESIELFRLLTTELALSDRKIDILRHILGLGESGFSVEKAANSITTYIESRLDYGDLPVAPKVTDSSRFDSSVMSAVYWPEVDGHTIANMQFGILSESADETYFTFHCLHFCKEHGFEQWHADLDDEPTWEWKSVVAQQQGAILPAVVSEFKDSPWDLGDPTEKLHPLLDTL